MRLTKILAVRLKGIKKLELCPAVLNFYSNRYSFGIFFNDIFSGVKLFLFLFPIILGLSFFSGVSPVQGLISSFVASLFAAILGGSKYQISSVAFLTSIVTFEIITKYQYKGLLSTAFFVCMFLIIFGLIKINVVLKHISNSFLSAISLYVVFAILTSQLQYILGVNSIQSSQWLFENLELLKSNLSNINAVGVFTALGFLVPLILLKSFFRGFAPFCIYLIIGSIISFASSLNIVPQIIAFKTIGQEFLLGQSIENITSITSTLPPQTVLGNCLNYALVIALIIASKGCFAINVSSSLTGDERLQGNIDLISSGLANFVSVACGGLFVEPDINLSIKNIQMQSKSVIPLLMIGALSYFCFTFGLEIIRFVPLYCISSILIIFAFGEFLNKKISQYFDLKKNDSYVFFATLFIAFYFGFVTAILVGFSMSCIFFAKRLIMIKDATVHTTKNHDSSAAEFMLNKNGFSKSLNIPQNILKKIEVIQVTNILFLNIAKVVEEGLLARGNYPSVLVIYFKNIPFLDTDALNSLKNIVKNAKKHNCIVIVCGTNGMLLDILQQKADLEKNSNTFGYIIPDFNEAIRQTLKRIQKG